MEIDNTLKNILHIFVIALLMIITIVSVIFSLLAMKIYIMHGSGGEEGLAQEILSIFILFLTTIGIIITSVSIKIKKEMSDKERSLLKVPLFVNITTFLIGLYIFIINANLL
jgi:hypothetical protein